MSSTSRPTAIMLALRESSAVTDIPLFGRGHSFVPALHKAGAAAHRSCQGWRSHRQRRLVLDGSEHGSMLDAAGTAEVFRCRSQGLASLRDGHGGPPSMG